MKSSSFSAGLHTMVEGEKYTLEDNPRDDLVQQTLYVHMYNTQWWIMGGKQIFLHLSVVSAKERGCSLCLCRQTRRIDCPPNHYRVTCSQAIATAFSILYCPTWAIHCSGREEKHCIWRNWLDVSLIQEGKRVNCAILSQCTGSEGVQTVEMPIGRGGQCKLPTWP